MARRRGFSHRSQGFRPSRDWGDGVGSQSSLSLSASGNAFLGAGVVTTTSEVTLLRTRGLFTAKIITATAAGDGFFGAIGIGLTTLAAFNAGISSVPTPVTEVGWDGWLYHSFFGVHSALGNGAGEPSLGMRIEVDSKAMRRFDAEQVLYAAIEVTEEGAATMDVFMDSRMLFQDAGQG